MSKDLHNWILVVSWDTAKAGIWGRSMCYHHPKQNITFHTASQADGINV